MKLSQPLMLAAIVAICLAPLRIARAWEPCMPFCDAKCSGPAAIKMGIVISQGVTQLVAQCTNVTAAQLRAAGRVTQLALDVGNERIASQRTFLSGLDAATLKLIANDEVSATILEAGIDTFTQSFVEAIKGRVKGAYLHKNSMNGSVLSQPEGFTQISNELYLEALSIEAKVVNELVLIVSEAATNGSNTSVKQQDAVEQIANFNTLPTIELVDLEDAKQIAKAYGFLNRISPNATEAEVAIFSVSWLTFAKSLAARVASFPIDNSTSVSTEKVIALTTLREIVEPASLSETAASSDIGALRKLVFLKQGINTRLGTLNSLRRQRNLKLAVELVRQANAPQ